MGTLGKGKSLAVVMPLSKKTQETKKKMTMTPPPPNKPRTKETTSAKRYTKKKVLEIWSIRFLECFHL